MTKIMQRRRIFQSGLAMVVLGAVLGITGVVTAPAGAAGNDHQITICHANEGSKGYSSPNPSKWQITAPNGHGSHPDDIIPPFAAGSKGSHSWGAYAGKNWTTENQAIYNAGCNEVPPAAGSITLDKITAGDGMPAGTTGFAFTVDCDTESGEVSNQAPSVAADDPATTIAFGLSEGDSCTITETNDQGATSTSYSVGGGAEQAGAAAVISITDAEQAVAVVFTNTFSCPTGTTPDGNGGCNTPCQPTTENNQCTPCPVGTPDGTGGCNTPCQPTTENNQCTPCPVGTPDGVGGCNTPCQPTTANNQCVPCPSGTTPTGQGTCVTDACPTVEGVQADVSECPVTVQDDTVTPAPIQTVTQAPAQAPAQVAGVQVAQLPRTGSTTLPLAQLGFGLVLMGIGALLFGKEQVVIA